MPNTPLTSPKSSNEESVTPSNEESVTPSNEKSVTPSNEESGSDSQQTFMNSLSDESCMYLLKLMEEGLSGKALADRVFEDQAKVSDM